MEHLPASLTRIPRTILYGVPLALAIAIAFGPNNWATHLAYHGWDMASSVVALHPLVQLDLFLCSVVLFYLQFEEKIRYTLTYLFYSDQAAQDRVKEKKAFEEVLRASQLGCGSARATTAA